MKTPDIQDWETRAGVQLTLLRDKDGNRIINAGFFKTGGYMSTKANQVAALICIYNKDASIQIRGREENSSRKFNIDVHVGSAHLMPQNVDIVAERGEAAFAYALFQARARQ